MAWEVHTVRWLTEAQLRCELCIRDLSESGFAFLVDTTLGLETRDCPFTEQILYKWETVTMVQEVEIQNVE